MIKYALSLFLALLTLTAIGQKKSVVILIKSDRTENVRRNGKDLIKVYKGIFKQDYSIMRSDSAYFYAQDNAFDGFGHVNITQGDTLNIFSDKLNYNGNTKVALFTDNVRMVDKDATLTTNILTYNTATRIGTYTGGGKLINKDNVLTSKNGYYFSRSRDAYFRYNVVLVTPDALIKTDTLKYSTESKIAYFLGPSNIYDAKDKKDTLYTENGLYNTITEQAFFGKNNLYKQGTKRMKGDSLFYDKVKGYGLAVKHVVFTDSEQKITMKGDLATYFKADEKTIVTKDPYVIIVTEEKDTSTKADSTAMVAATPAKGKTTTQLKTPASNNLPLKTAVNGALAMPQLKALKKDSIVVVTPATVAQAKAAAMPQLQKLAKDSLLKMKPPAGTMPVKALPMPQLKTPAKDTTGANTGKVKRDSMYISADSLETQIMTYKNYKIMQETARLSRLRDTTAKGMALAANLKPSKFLSVKHPKFTVDSSFFHKDLFGKPKPVASKTVKAGPQRKPEVSQADNEPEIRNIKRAPLSDTARIRIVIAHHHAKLFKSDLQSKADSMFYSYSDSTLRSYVEPIIWTQGSQLSGDTIYMQMHNKKLDNLDLFPSAFIVNVEKKDSTHFNQLAGKRMKGYFKDDKLDRMYVTGNAESIYFVRDSVKVTEMQRSLASRMRIRFKDNSASRITFLTQPDHKYAGVGNFKEDDRILKGFKWKPKERPFSKESILPSYNRKRNAAQAKLNPVAKPGIIPPGKANGKMPADSVQRKIRPGSLPNTVKDSINVKPSAQPVKTKKDSVMPKPSPVLSPKKDSTQVKRN